MRDIDQKKYKTSALNCTDGFKNKKCFIVVSSVHLKVFEKSFEELLHKK